MDNSNNNENKKDEDNGMLAINKKRIFASLSAKVVRCSKRTINATSEVFEAILTKDKSKIVQLSEKGLPDDLQMLRALVWKINLGYLSINYEQWETYLTEKRRTYQYYKKRFTDLLKNEIEQKNYKSKKVLEDITKDVNRTHLGFAFFFQPISKEKHFTSEELHQLFKKRQNCSIKDINDIYRLNIEETHADVLARMLFIYSKFTPDISYHQGMNEILAPIYYCYSYDKLYTEETEDTVEADTFWSFYLLMEDIRSSFDNSDKKGTEFKNNILKQILTIVDKEIYDKLESNDVKFEFFVYRWFISFFSQNFDMGDVLKLWDLIFSHENKFYYVFYFSIAILIYKRDEILKNDLSGIMMSIQNLEDIRVDQLINLVILLKKEFDSQIRPLIDLTNRNEKEILLSVKKS